MKQPQTSPNDTPQEAIQSRLDFLELGDDDVARLNAMQTRFAEGVDEMVDIFYRHLFRFQFTSRFLGDERVVAHLKATQAEHFTSLLAADWNEAYVERRRLVGQTHAEVGIGPELFLGAYNQYLQYCLSHYLKSDDPALREAIAGFS